MGHHDYIQNGKKMFKMKSKNTKIRHQAYKAIFREYKSLIQALPRVEKMEPTLTNIIPLLSEFYNCNITVRETRGADCIIYSQPNGKNYRHDWPRIDLHQKMDLKQSFGHISLISPRNYGYISDYGWTCNFCDKRTLGKCHRHRL